MTKFYHALVINKSISLESKPLKRLMQEYKPVDILDDYSIEYNVFIYESTKIRNEALKTFEKVFGDRVGVINSVFTKEV